jgi:hypothetical protein
MESGAFENHLLGDGPSPLPPRYLTMIEESTMDIYNLTEVDTTMDGKKGVLLQGFNIIGVDGRPLVTLSFETQSEAEAAGVIAGQTRSATRKCAVHQRGNERERASEQ